MDNETHWTGQLSDRQRAVAAGVSALLHILGFAALLGWSRAQPVAVVERTLDVIELDRPPLIEPRPPRRPEPRRRSGAAAPPDLKNVPKAMVAPPPIILLPPPPLLAAPIAGPGAALDSGAAPVAGPGTGAGGEGVGRGSGTGDGDGSGDGDGDGDGGTPPRQIGGRMRDSDYPKGLGVEGIQGRVSVRYLVSETGRVSDCEVTASSGSTTLDETTCRLITERFRFRPSRDGRGQPVASYVVENHDWIVERDTEQDRPGN